MNKRILKKFLIIIGLILLGLNFIICLINSGEVFETLFDIVFETFVEFGELESILSISGITLLTFGILIKNENASNETKNDKKAVRKYKLLRILGYMPFIGILIFATYSAISGISFLFSTSYGFDAFLGSILLLSLFLWPLYIIGIILIIKSSSKIRNFEESQTQNIN